MEAVNNAWPSSGYESLDEARAKAAIAVVDEHRGYYAPSAWDED